MDDDELRDDEAMEEGPEPTAIERSGLIDPTPLPAMVAMDEPPISDDLLAKILAPALTSELRAQQDEALDEADAALSRWAITDESSAEWAGGRFTEMTDAIADVDTEHKGYLKRLTLWREMRVAPLERFRAHLEAMLLEYGRERREATGGKIKTTSTPSVSVSSRSGQDRFDVTDEAELIAYLEALCDADTITTAQLEAAVKVKKSILKGGLAAVLKVDSTGKVYDEATGQLVPGVEFHKGEVSYKVASR